MSVLEHYLSTGRDSVVTAAPHRLFFLGGAVQLVATLVFWLYMLAGQYLSAWAVPELAISSFAAHGYLMLYGLFTFFVFGFLTTVFPRWLNTEVIPRRRYVTLAGLLLAGVAFFYLGVFLSRPLAAAGASLFSLGWGLGLVTLLGIWRASGSASKRFALFPFSCVTAGWAGSCVFAVWLITGQAGLLSGLIPIGLWLYLVPLVVAVSYRMIPFFSSRILSPYTVVKPVWTLPATLGWVLLHFALIVSGQAQWTILADLPLAALAIWHSVHWQLIRSLRIPLLGMLHVSFAWLGIAMLLYSAQSLLQLTGAGASLGMAPLHALGIGFVASMVVAMASRVSLGHSGRALVADRVTIWAFAVIQATAVIRVLSELAPLKAHPAGTWLTLLGGAVWLAAFIPWSLRFGKIYVSPRVDGRPG